MQTQNTKRILRSLAAVTVLLVLAALIIPQRKLSVVIMDPKFRLLDARISHGTTHELAKDNWPITQLAKLLHFVDARVVVPTRLPPMPENSYALAVRFTGDFAPNALSGVKAELVEASGTVTPLWSAAGYVSGKNTLSEYGRIWLFASPPTHDGRILLLASPPTHVVTIRLTPGSGQAPLAEIRIRGF